jgi:heme-degrading monooxygenase HmoA
MLHTPRPTGHAEQVIKKTFVALSRFVIANDMREQVKEAFLNRPHLVDDAPGFVSMDVISPLEEPDEIWLITYWTAEESYRTWHHSHVYHASHKGIPKGLKLVPKSANVRFFEYISS